jgi:hypothetical protein
MFDSFIALGIYRKYYVRFVVRDDPSDALLCSNTPENTLIYNSATIGIA